MNSHALICASGVRITSFSLPQKEYSLNVLRELQSQQLVTKLLNGSLGCCKHTYSILITRSPTITACQQLTVYPHLLEGPLGSTSAPPCNAQSLSVSLPPSLLSSIFFLNPFIIPEQHVIFIPLYPHLLVKQSWHI